MPSESTSAWPALARLGQLSHGPLTPSESGSSPAQPLGPTQVAPRPLTSGAPHSPQLLGAPPEHTTASLPWQTKSPQGGQGSLGRAASWVHPPQPLVTPSSTAPLQSLSSPSHS